MRRNRAICNPVTDLFTLHRNGTSRAASTTVMGICQIVLETTKANAAQLFAFGEALHNGV